MLPSTLLLWITILCLIFRATNEPFDLTQAIYYAYLMIIVPIALILNIQFEIRITVTLLTTIIYLLLVDLHRDRKVEASHVRNIVYGAGIGLAIGLIFNLCDRIMFNVFAK